MASIERSEGVPWVVNDLPPPSEFKDEAVRQVTERDHPVTGSGGSTGCLEPPFVQVGRSVRQSKEEERSIVINPYSL